LLTLPKIEVGNFSGWGNLADWAGFGRQELAFLDRDKRADQVNVTNSPEAASDGPIGLVSPRRTRIDQPHALSSAPPDLASDAAGPREPPSSEQVLLEQVLLEIEEPTAEMIAAVAGESLDSRREQLRVQVAQLAGHLRERLRDVDRRESTLNARVAQLESDLRASRMWLRERELAFQERENELRRQIEELQEVHSSRANVAEDHVVDPEVRQAELTEREQQLLLREDDLRERRFEVDRQAAALRHSQQVWQQQREREERQLTQEREKMARGAEESVAQREQQLRAAELLLSEHAQQLDRDRTSLVADRQAWSEHQARQRQAIDELRAAAEMELTGRRTRLEARQEWIERQKGGLEQVRDEALRLHRQAIEMRLLAEQLWSQITGNLAPAEVTQAIAQLRLKLAEQYRIEEQQLVARRDELVELSERVAGQHRELEQLRSGLREWAASRQGEIQRQAATLVERELAMDAQQESFRQQQHQWHADRRRYEQQIRDLTCQLRTVPAAA
jgi:exonuclease SbcC